MMGSGRTRTSGLRNQISRALHGLGDCRNCGALSTELHRPVTYLSQNATKINNIRRFSVQKPIYSSNYLVTVDTRIIINDIEGNYRAKTRQAQAGGPRTPNNCSMVLGKHLSIPASLRRKNHHVARNWVYREAACASANRVRGTNHRCESLSLSSWPHKRGFWPECDNFRPVDHLVSSRTKIASKN
jgi:hypothetical protein